MREVLKIEEQKMENKRIFKNQEKNEKLLSHSLK